MVKGTASNLMTTCTEIILLLNDVMDDVILRRKFSFDFYHYLVDENVSKSEIEMFNKSTFVGVIQFQIKEFEDFLKGGDIYLKEAYAGYSKPEVRRMKDYLIGLIESARQYEKLKKTRRPYKRKKTTTK
jgi:hypothetical protein